MEAIGGLAALAFLICAGGFVARQAANMPRTPAGIRRGAAATANGIRHPIRTARAGVPRAGETAESIWARARAEDWLERRRTARERRASRPPRTETAGRAARAIGRGARGAGRGVAGAIRRIPHPKVAIKVPGVTDVPPQRKPAVPVLVPVPQPSPATTPAPEPPAERQPAMPSPRGSVTPHHAALNAYVASFEPESDGDLLRFMSGEAAGMAGYAQAVEQLQEHLLSTVGLDPAAVQGMTEYAQAAAEAAALMTRANSNFQKTYQGVRETVASGTVLPFRGRFMTGESA